MSDVTFLMQNYVRPLFTCCHRNSAWKALNQSIKVFILLIDMTEDKRVYITFMTLQIIALLNLNNNTSHIFEKNQGKFLGF